MEWNWKTRKATDARVRRINRLFGYGSAVAEIESDGFVTGRVIVTAQVIDGVEKAAPTQ